MHQVAPRQLASATEVVDWKPCNNLASSDPRTDQQVDILLDLLLYHFDNTTETLYLLRYFHLTPVCKLRNGGRLVRHTMLEGENLTL